MANMQYITIFNENMSLISLCYFDFQEITMKLSIASSKGSTVLLFLSLSQIHWYLDYTSRRQQNFHFQHRYRLPTPPLIFRFRNQHSAPGMEAIRLSVIFSYDADSILTLLLCQAVSNTLLFGFWEVSVSYFMLETN